jgi:acyl-CoA synthetase (AMP-forming)/AMP-acid ligase II
MPATLPEFLLHWAHQTPDKAFVGEPDRGQACTYGDVARRVAVARARFRRAGTGRGDRVAILADNAVHWVVAYLAAIAHGAVAVPLNTRHVEGDLATILDGIEPAVIAADPAYLTSVPDRHRRRVIATADLEPPASAPAPGLDGSEASGEEVGIVCYTSGTTGVPRGVMIPNHALVRNAAMFADIFQSGPDSATAVVCPLFHNTGYNDGLAHMLLVNGRVDVPRRYSPDVTARAVTEGRYTFLIGVPTIYGRMLPGLEASPPPARSSPWFAYGGAPMPGPLASRLAELAPGARLVNVYGLSEATSMTHYLPWRPGPRDLAAIGVAVPGTLDRVTADGELQVVSPTVMRGYWRDAEATRRRFDGAWLRTGDVARRGADGLLRLLGRADDLINRGGEKVAPVEVESAISAHPEVAEVGVVGVPDADLGEVVAAAVVVRPGGTLDEPELARFLGDRLADYKRPRQVRFLPALPRNENGKVIKSALRRLLGQT